MRRGLRRGVATVFSRTRSQLQPPCNQAGKTYQRADKHVFDVVPIVRPPLTIERANDNVNANYVFILEGSKDLEILKSNSKTAPQGPLS